MKDWRVLVAAIVSLASIEMVALSQGIDGSVLTVVIGIIALIAGVPVGAYFTSNKK